MKYSCALNKHKAGNLKCNRKINKAFNIINKEIKLKTVKK